MLIEWYKKIHLKNKKSGLNIEVYNPKLRKEDTGMRLNWYFVIVP